MVKKNNVKEGRVIIGISLILRTLAQNILFVVRRATINLAIVSSDGWTGASSAMGHMNMVNRDVDIICANSSTKRAFGYDMISKKCFQAFEAYRRGNISCQIHPCHTLETFQVSELHRHDDRAAKESI